MKTAAVYARYSSHKQREESIEEQVAECREYAENNDMTIVEIYSDSAISGKTEEREGWQRMMDDAKKHKFEALLVYTIDRMGRDRYALAVAKQALKECGVTVYAIKQPVVEGPESIILDALMEGLAEYYNADLARKVERGMGDNAHKGLANGSKPPLGYKVDPLSKKYIIDEEGANIVRFVFDSYNSGMKIKEIMEECERRCYRNSNGKPIDKNVVNRMLKNAKYTGLYKWKDVEIPDGMPRIISDETFQLAQLRLDKMTHKNAHGKANKEYLLAEKVFCGKCGDMWVGESGYSANGKFYSYYKCRGAKSKKCGMKAISQKKLENKVYEILMFELFPDDEAIEKYVDFHISHRSKDNSYEKQIRQYEKQLNATQTKIDNIMQAVMQGIGIETAKNYIAPLEEDKKQLELLISEAKSKAKDVDRDRLIGVLKKWLDITALISTVVEYSPDEEVLKEDKRLKLYKNHMRAILKSPVLQKVIIECDDDGTPDPKIKLGIDISRLLGDISSSGTEQKTIQKEKSAIKNDLFDYQIKKVTKREVSDCGSFEETLLYWDASLFSYLLNFQLLNPL